jgi:phenylalanyl-tRNA synthetase beta chain
MRFSERWLREWVSPPLDTAGLAARLTSAGLEVDSVTPVAERFTGVVVGHVLEVAPHPSADRLRVCRVDAGGAEPLTIVCGAPNVAVGMRAPTALVGAKLSDGMEIRRATLRGVESSGMLCSARELGLAETSEGLLPLPGDAPVGADIVSYLGLDDVAIEVDLTPNRSDCLSVEGVAREVGVLTREPVRGLPVEPLPAAIPDTFPVELEAPADCPRYVGRVVRNVDPRAETPLWMKERLRRSGLRSISPVVDVTNYVLLELGQPMHAFDLERLSGAIRIRRGGAGQSLTILDGTRIEPDADCLVIADDRGPVALAGIMGGLDSGVTAESRHIFLESAFFSPSSIAGRARRYGLATDSSHRFERGVDFALQRRAMERATDLLVAIAGGECGPVIERVAPEHLPTRAPIALRAARLRAVLGLSVAPDVVTDVLVRLGCQVDPRADGWTVTPPSFRFDLAIEVDLIEEVARVTGYEKVPTTVPVAHLDVRPVPEATVPLERLRAVLVDRGYQEAITYSFVDPALQAQIEPGEEAIRLANPISADMAVMRTSLWPGLLKALAHNRNRQQGRVWLFETGLRFRRRDGRTIQEPVLAGLASGTALPEQWGLARRAVDFYDVKADLEALLALTGAAGAFRFEPAAHPALHPGQAALVRRGDREIGLLGALHPAHLRSLDVEGPVYLFELALDGLRSGVLPRFAPLSRFPAIRRDLAVVVDEGVPAEAVRAAIGQTAGDMLNNLELFDVYRGEGIDAGRKSLALSLILQAPDRTLQDAEVEAVVKRVLDSLEREYKATLRA